MGAWTQRSCTTFFAPSTDSQETPMIGYVSVGTNDFQRAGFYDKLMAELGAKRVMDSTPSSPGAGQGQAGICARPAAQQEAGNRRQRLDGRLPGRQAGEGRRSTRRRSSLGATDEGPPGDRGDNYYGAYFRDLDGNKLNFHCWT